MKKFILLLATMVFLTNSFVVSAQEESPVTLSATEVEVNQETGEFQFDILIHESEAYAGMEFGMVCGSECEILTVEYDKEVNTTGLAENDLIWFGFFDGEDSFTESFTATVSGVCKTGADSVMALKTVKKYTIGNSEYKEEEFLTDTQINLVASAVEAQVEEGSIPLVAATENGVSTSGLMIICSLGAVGIAGVLIYMGLKPGRKKAIERQNALNENNGS